VLHSGRQLSSHHGVDGDNTIESELMRGHLFYVFVVVSCTVCARILLNSFYLFNGWELPIFFAAPRPELKIAFFLLMVRWFDKWKKCTFDTAVLNNPVLFSVFFLLLLLLFFSFFREQSMSAQQSSCNETLPSSGNLLQLWNFRLFSC
jgi:hypothetical protein